MRKEKRIVDPTALREAVIKDDGADGKCKFEGIEPRKRATVPGIEFLKFKTMKELRDLT